MWNNASGTPIKLKPFCCPPQVGTLMRGEGAHAGLYFISGGPLKQSLYIAEHRSVYSGTPLSIAEHRSRAKTSGKPLGAGVFAGGFCSGNAAFKGQQEMKTNCLRKHKHAHVFSITEATTLQSHAGAYVRNGAHANTARPREQRRGCNDVT